MPLYIVKYGVRGAMRINETHFDTRTDAEAFMSRWTRSNSTGHYWAKLNIAVSK